MATVQTIELLQLAQYAMAAAHAQLNNRLSADAEAVLSEWMKAGDYLRKALREFPDSAAARSARLALGMLIQPHMARIAATTECAALLDTDTLRQQIADGDWEGVADVLVRDVIDTYHGTLLAATGVQR